MKEKITKWVIISKGYGFLVTDQSLYDTEAEAREEAKEVSDVVDIVPVTFEE